MICKKGDNFRTFFFNTHYWNNDHCKRYLVLFNSSLNFVIYCFVGSNFRQTLKKTICFGFRQTEEQREEVLMTENNKNENTGASVTEMSLFDTEDEQTEDEANIEGNILMVSRCWMLLSFYKMLLFQSLRT